jgi:hypothetical protein
LTEANVCLAVFIVHIVGGQKGAALADAHADELAADSLLLLAALVYADYVLFRVC